MSKVDDFLQHYASEFYDAEKAHAYYLKTRQLKPRTTSGLGEKQKEAWAYAKNGITDKKNLAVQAAKDAEAKNISNLRAQASQMRANLSSRLKMFGASSSSAERQKIASNLTSAISKIRTDYNAAKVKLNSDYESKYQTEYNNITTKIAGDPKSKGKGKAKAKPKAKKPAVTKDSIYVNGKGTIGW